MRFFTAVVLSLVAGNSKVVALRISYSINFYFVSGVAAFAPMKSTIARRALSMSEAGTSDARGGKLTSPGKNLKPMFDGTFKEAGAPLDQYVLENENGSRVSLCYVIYE